MDANLLAKAEQLAGENAGQARTLSDLNGLMRTMMASALERMLDSLLNRTNPTLTCLARILQGKPDFT